MADGDADNMPASGSIEDLIRRVDATDPSATSFSLYVPSQLTWEGHSVPSDMAMAVVLDRLLGAGFMPAGFEQRDAGRLYRYERTTEA